MLGRTSCKIDSKIEYPMIILRHKLRPGSQLQRKKALTVQSTMAISPDTGSSPRQLNTYQQIPFKTPSMLPACLTQSCHSLSSPILPLTCYRLCSTQHRLITKTTEHLSTHSFQGSIQVASLSHPVLPQSFLADPSCHLSPKMFHPTQAHRQDK